jgi:hypothetical protein
MKSKILNLKSIVLFILFSVIATMVLSYPGGAPAGKTGSPADVSLCTSCHDASVKTQTGMISSNAAGNEYIPGKTYTITATASGSASVKRIGFEVSPQDKTGKLLGKLILTNTIDTKFSGTDGKYVTHTNKGSQVNGKKTWSFNWVAPAKGTGTVVFYGAFLVSEKLQLVYRSTLELKEKTN